jgi:purine nucleosidase
MVVQMTDQLPKPIIIDTDPGQDDAIAVLFALAAHNQLDVLGITAVAGNVPVNLTSRNARIIAGWANRSDVPVFAGCSRPLVRELITAEQIHGTEGLGGVPLHEPRTGLGKGHAVEFLVKTLSQSPERTITLCCIGPLTNLACALIQSPEIARQIKEVVIMGGAYFTRGNITPVAEFNVYVDPHAAAVVFSSGLSITVFPLDVTHKVLTTRARIELFRKIGNQAGRLISDILTHQEQREIGKPGFKGSPLHDPCTIGYLLDPSLFTGRRVNVSIETASELTLGETVIDWNGITAWKANAYWMTDVDSERFYSLLTKAIAGLP